MIIPTLLNDPEFMMKLKPHQSLTLDSLIDDIITNINESYLLYCDQFPIEEDMRVTNHNRINMIRTFEQLKTTHHED